jgi:triacylglycerol lipase
MSLAILIAVVIAIALIVALTALAIRRLPPSAPHAAAPAPDGVTIVTGAAPRGPPLPVVLVHGLYGFDRIGVPGVKLHYFRGLARHLDGLGCPTHAVRLPAAASVPARAAALVKAIEALPHARVDVIAHSLGGLDARYALARLGLATRVRSLVTVGTPHRGTPLADLAVGGPFDWARRIVRALGVPVDALEWLSTAALDRFNREITDVPGVRYGCVAGGVTRPSTPIALALRPAHAYLRRVSGVNDGLVPLASQYWGETIAEIEADHFAQVGWQVQLRRSFDALGLYAFVIARLGDAPGAAAAGAAAVSASRPAPAASPAP